MREILFREAECAFVGSGLDRVFVVGVLEDVGSGGTGVGGARRNGGRVRGIVARARGERDE